MKDIISLAQQALGMDTSETNIINVRTHFDRGYSGGREFEDAVDAQLAEQREGWIRAAEEIAIKKQRMEQVRLEEQKKLAAQIEEEQRKILLEAQPRFGVIPNDIFRKFNKLNGEQLDRYIKHLFDRHLL